MTDIQLRILMRAIKIRMSRGEAIDDILASYPRLTDSEKSVIKQTIVGA